jgi:hypothetical protein
MKARIQKARVHLPLLLALLNIKGQNLAIC